MKQADERIEWWNKGYDDGFESNKRKGVTSFPTASHESWYQDGYALGATHLAELERARAENDADNATN